ncbi:MAG: DUF1501 domain-containing protein [Planctomyces sp.]|nr:DUF1501 domain-containing protein [Planctomyces sp.]
MKFSRRDFLAASAVVGAGLPGIFRRAAWAAPKSDQPGGRDTVLVVVQLTGGNDGLNTVIPFRHPVYAASRPTLVQPADRIRRIDDDLAFHPELEGFSTLLEQGALGIVQGVGYPNPNRSHFESMDIWHKATPSSQERYGWLARSTPLMGAGAIYSADAAPPLALYGSTGYAPSLKSLVDYRLKTPGDDPDVRAAIESFAASQPDENDLLSFVRSSARQTYESSERIARAAAEYAPAASYPETPLGQHLKLFAQLIDAGVPERVYYTSLDGFDTHAAQSLSHGQLLRNLADSVLAFREDLKHHGHDRRVLTVMFSEFGRRVNENGSQGTDHGTAAPMFLVGDAIRTGPIGAHPSLDDLDDGDLKFHTDFRSVYAALLERWLGVDPARVLDGNFAPSDLFA